MTTYEELSIIVSFASLIVLILTYVKKRKMTAHANDRSF